MIGSVIGDIIGSRFEWNNTKSKEFKLFAQHSEFTDDSVLSVAVADAILHHGDYGRFLRDYGRRYPGRGYGSRFEHWLEDDSRGPFNSFGNGSAMRVGPVGFAFDTLAKVLAEARRSAVPTHDHAEGIKGAQAAAACVFLARTGSPKSKIKSYVISKFGYDLNRRIDNIRPDYEYDVTCQGTVPEAIICFLESNSFEDAIRNAISIGGDSDTLACITGGIAEAFYKEIPPNILMEGRSRIHSGLLKVIDEFERIFAM